MTVFGQLIILGLNNIKQVHIILRHKTDFTDVWNLKATFKK